MIDEYVNKNISGDNGIEQSMPFFRNAKWIGAPYKHDKTVNLRRFINIKRNVKKAMLYSTARGFYEFYIDGEKLGNTFYNPGFTDYRKRIYYQTYNVTDKITMGLNSIGAIVTKGYYTGCVGYSGKNIYGNENTLFAVLVIEYDDGGIETVCTDEDWQFTKRGQVVDADYLQGETYDARLEIDWNTQNAFWEKCGVYHYSDFAEPTNGRLKDEPFLLCAEPDCGAVAYAALKPVNPVYEMPEGHFIFDIGQNIAGTIRLKMNGLRGRGLVIKYGEMCYRDGRIYNENYRTAANTDIYIMKGGLEEFTPTFTSHGFRYIEISGYKNLLTREEFENMIVSAEGIVITNTPKVTGDFECSDSNINKLFSNIIWGQRGNSLLVFTDCPQRNERMGWTGDAQVFAKTAAYNMDIRKFMKKWLTDLRDAQLMYNLNGAVPDTAPLGGDNRKGGGCGGWGDAAVFVPWEMYKFYGDTKFLSDNYEMMKKWVDYQNRADRQNGYIQIMQSRGDHLAIDTSTPIRLCATAYAAQSAKLLSCTAEVLGKDGDTKKYMELHNRIKYAFNEKWINPDGTISYVSDDGDTKHNGSQTSYALAIDFGLIDKEQIEGAKKGFKRSVEDWDNKLSVGFLGISHLLPALSKVGLWNEAFALLEETEYPSWLYSVINGATTIWERWNSYIASTDTFGDVRMNSFNHYAYGAVGEWMYGSVLGINTSEKKGETGFKKIILTPHTGGKLTYAKGSLETSLGVIKSSWEKIGDKVKYSFTIPDGAAADLFIDNKKIPLNGGNYEFWGREN